MCSENVDYERTFEDLDKIGFLVICAWCQENKNTFNVIRYDSQSKEKGMSHGICNECLKWAISSSLS